MRPTTHQSHLPQRKLVEKLERHLLATGAAKVRLNGQELDDAPTSHHFTPGLYVRTMFLPAGMIGTGRIHRTEHPYIISQGHCIVHFTDTGPIELRAPYMGITHPGTQRVIVSIKDTIWTSFHPTDLTDVEAIEEEILEPLSPHLVEYAQKGVT